jgi:hypothetical protein
MQIPSRGARIRALELVIWYFSSVRLTATNVTPLLQVYDMRNSVEWHCDVLGFEVLQKHEPEGHLYWAMLKLGDAVLMLNAKY